MITVRRYSVSEAAPMLWYSTGALMRVLEKYPQFFETSLNWECYKDKGITLDEAKRDPECVMLDETEIDRLQKNQVRFETCAGCRETFLLQELTGHWIESEYVLVCAECEEKSVTCDLCNALILEREPSHSEWTEGGYKYYHPSCWKIMEE